MVGGGAAGWLAIKQAQDAVREREEQYRKEVHKEAAERLFLNTYPTQTAAAWVLPHSTVNKVGGLDPHQEEQVLAALEKILLP